MQCIKCKTDAPLYPVTFRQNIGLLVMHISKTFSGAYCKKCAYHRFWGTFFTNLFLGWWGVKSFFYTFFFMFSNIAQVFKLMKMKPLEGSSMTAEPVITE
jgi:hypothetical protein